MRAPPPPGAHAHSLQILSTKTSEALSRAVDAALLQCEPMAGACVPMLPAPQREAYIKMVASTAGVAALASAVARNASQMLPLIAMGACVLVWCWGGEAGCVCVVGGRLGVCGGGGNGLWELVGCACTCPCWVRVV